MAGDNGGGVGFMRTGSTILESNRDTGTEKMSIYEGTLQRLLTLEVEEGSCRGTWSGLTGQQLGPFYRCGTVTARVRPGCLTGPRSPVDSGVLPYGGWLVPAGCPRRSWVCL